MRLKQLFTLAALLASMAVAVPAPGYANEGHMAKRGDEKYYTFSMVESKKSKNDLLMSYAPKLALKPAHGCKRDLERSKSPKPSLEEARKWKEPGKRQDQDPNPFDPNDPDGEFGPNGAHRYQPGFFGP
ncbi:hypothetical protein MMC12_004372 [Toensbergia leucococca]|nr:hypothetical protein [Toensbergia leucococca]